MHMQRENLPSEKNRELVSQIKTIHQKGRVLYGSPRVHAKLKELGNFCSRKRVARLMKENGIAAKGEEKLQRIC